MPNVRKRHPIHLSTNPWWSTLHVQDVCNNISHLVPFGALAAHVFFSCPNFFFIYLAFSLFFSTLYASTDGQFCEDHYYFVCVWSLCGGVCLSCVCNFRVYSIAETLLPGFSPHLTRTFITSIPAFLLFLGLFTKTRWPPCLLFYFIFSHWLLLQTRHGVNYIQM